MPKNPHADFSPVLKGYSGQSPFKFWCQMALPLTYDDSLSYYELLNKVVSYLNNTISDVANVEDNVGSLLTSFTQLQDYVNTYFDELDIEQELRNVLDKMALDGTLDEILSPIVEIQLPGVVENQIDGAVGEQIDGAVGRQIDSSVEGLLPGAVAGEVGEWLDENLEPTSPPVDPTLTIANAAADAKVTGEKIENLKNNIESLKSNENYIKYNDGAMNEHAASSNMPNIRRTGNILFINGEFGAGGSSGPFYIKLSGSFNVSAVTSTANAWEKTVPLEKGKRYKAKFELLSGTVNKSNSQDFMIRIFDSTSTGRVFIDMNETEEFTWNDSDALIQFRASAGITCINATTVITIEDITEEYNLKQNINNLNNELIKQTLLSQYTWENGKHDSRGRSITEPTASTNTICLIASIPCDYNMFFNLASGWTAAFAMVENDIITFLPAAFVEYDNFISMKQIFEGTTKGSVGDFGDSITISLRKADASNINPNSLNIDDIIKMYKVIKEKNPNGETKWVAIGDSITDGRLTITNGTNVYTKTNHFSQYGYIASKIIGVDEYIEYGYSGLGYVSIGGDGTTLNDLLSLDFGSPDIITVNLGVNDTSNQLGDQNSLANDGTISGAIRNCCEMLGNAYPKSHIIFMTPTNKSTIGTAATGWAKRSGNSSLQDIANMIKYWCGYYGFDVIDMLNEGPINDLNIKQILLDNLHPSIEGHYLLGHYLAGTLKYKII